jgi:CRP-like cAMP-binding protein
VKDMPIYKQGEIAESFFFIYRGSINMLTGFGDEFMRYNVGDTIGESDCILGEPRDCKAVAAE